MTYCMTSVVGSDAIRLNLGCWVFQRTSANDRLAGWVNVDLNPVYHPDLVADAAYLPYEDGTVDEIYAGHLLEHMRPEVPALAEWHRVLAPGGILTVVVPDIQRALDYHFDGKINRDFLNAVAFGGADDHAALQMHQRIYTERLLWNEMYEAGFRDLHVLDESGILWQTGIQGTKGEAQ